MSRRPWLTAGGRFRPSIRLRLALLLTGLFVLVGAVLLTASYALVKSNLNISDRQLHQAAARKLGHPFPDGHHPDHGFGRGTDHRVGAGHDHGASPGGGHGAGRGGSPGAGAGGGPGAGAQPNATGGAGGPADRGGGARSGGGAVQGAGAGPGGTDDATRALLHQVRQQLVSRALNRLLVEYLIGMAALTLLAGVGGWLLAGRVLRPLKRITRTAQAVSQEESLHHRIALDGPQDELKELADTFDDMLGRLDAAFQRQRAFVANASHELRTPLTIIRTEADVALDKPRPDVAGLLQGMGSIRQATERSERLIDGLLTLARVDRGTSQRTAIGLKSFASDAVQEIAAQARQRSISISTELEPANVVGDLRLLETLLRNLLENAVRYNRPGGWITIRTATRGDAAVLEVENSGDVVPPELASQLTQPFQRVNRHHADGEGVGLGLSIVSAITAAHDGTLAIAARPEGGLRATVELRASPAARPSREPAPGRRAPDVPEPAIPEPGPA